LAAEGPVEDQRFIARFEHPGTGSRVVERVGRPPQAHAKRSRKVHRVSLGKRVGLKERSTGAVAQSVSGIAVRCSVDAAASARERRGHGDADQK
jgi:hypothetical protein